MADPPALRVRRSRQHQQGDHSLCRPGRCDWASAQVAAAMPQFAPVLAPPAPAPPGERQPGGIESAVQAFVDTLPYVAPDPRALLALVAIRLAQRVDETGALPAAVRELRVLLSQLVEVPNGPAGVVDETRLRAAQRRLDIILGNHQVA